MPLGNPAGVAMGWHCCSSLIDITTTHHDTMKRDDFDRIWGRIKKKTTELEVFWKGDRVYHQATFFEETNGPPNFTEQKLTCQLEKQPFEDDVSPFENGVFRASHVSFRGCM